MICPSCLISGINPEFTIIIGTCTVAMLLVSLVGMFLGYLIGRMHMFKMIMALPFIDAKEKLDIAAYFNMEKLLEVET